MSKRQPASGESNQANRQESTFMYGQTLKHFFTGMSYAHGDLHRMIDYLKEECKTQPQDLKQIEEFANGYTLNRAVWYYTRYPFLYRRLNAALRECDVVAMYKMGIFIRDLHHQIVDIHRNTFLRDVLTLYRGVFMPMPVFEQKLHGREGDLLSMNQFWSTSKKDDVARIFADQSSLTSDAAVLFSITVDPSASTMVSFANIQAISHFGDEEEYLFTMGSVFRIASIEQIDGNKVWHVLLTLTTDRDDELMSMTEYHRSIDPVPNVVSLCLILCEMGDFATAVEIGESVMESTKTAVEKMILHYAVGQAYSGMSYYDRMVEHYRKALTYCEQLDLSIVFTHPVIIMKTVIFWVEGNIDQALLVLEQGIDYEINHPSPIHGQTVLAYYYAYKSKILTQNGQLSEANRHNQEANRYSLECFPSVHPIRAFNMEQSARIRFLSTSVESGYEPMRSSREIYQRTQVSNDRLRAENDVVLTMFEQIHNNRTPYDVHPRKTSVVLQSRRENTPAILLTRIQQFFNETRHGDALSTIDEYFALQKDQDCSLDPNLYLVYYYKGLCHVSHGDLSEALPSFRKTEELAVSRLPSKHVMRLAIPLHIAVIYAQQMHDDEALRLVEQTDPDMLAQSHDVATTLKALVKNIALVFQSRAFLCRREKQENKALDLFRKSLKVQLAYLPKDHPKIAATYGYMAESYAIMNNLSEALANYQQAQHIWEACSIHTPADAGSTSSFSSFLQSSCRACVERLGAENTTAADLINESPFTHSKLLVNYTNCAEICFLQNNLVEAIVYYHHALDVQFEHISRSDRAVALLWMKLGNIYDIIQLFDDALDAFSNALQIYLSMIAPKPSDLATTYKLMGFVCVDTKQYDAALSHFNECLQIDMLSLRRDNAALADMHRCIGLIFERQGNQADAQIHRRQYFEIQNQRASTEKRPFHIKIKRLERCFTIREQAGEKSPRDHRSIVPAPLGEENHAKTVEQFKRCLATQLASLSNDHPDIAATYLSLADVMCESHRPADAVNYYEYALEILNKHLPKTCSKAIEIWKKLGHLYFKLRQLEDSLSAYAEALTMQLNIVSDDHHLDTAATHKHIALIEYVMGAYDDALVSFENCLKIQMAVLPGQHPYLLDTQSCIGDLRCKLSKSPDSSFNNQ